MPYKHGVTGSSPVVPTKYGPVVQSVSTPACHAGGRRFESVRGRHKNTIRKDGVFVYVHNGLEQSNATVRWTVAHRRLDGGDTIIVIPRE